MIRFNVRDAVQSAASIVEGQLAGRQAAMDQLQAQQQQALQNRLRLFQYGQDSENANRKVLADLLPDVSPDTQRGILDTLNQPSRYSAEALMRPGPLDLSQAPQGAPAGAGGAPGTAPDATRPGGMLPNTQQFLGRPVSSSLFGGQANSEAAVTPSPSMGAGAPGTSAPPATLSGQVQAADNGLNNMASSPLGDPAMRTLTARQMVPGNTASPGLEWLARGTPAGGGNTAAPVASAPSGQGGPQRPDKKQSKLTRPLQPTTPPTAGAGGAGTGAAFTQQPLPNPEEAAPGAAQRSFFSPYQKQQQPPAQPAAQPLADQGATGTAGGGSTATTPEGVPFTYQGAHGPATGYYTGGNRSPAQQEARAAQDANQLWGVIGAKAILPDSPLAKLLDQYGADLTGPFNSPASVQKFYQALAKVRPHLGESLETQTETNRQKAEQDRKQHEQDQSDAEISKSLNAFSQKEYQSQGQYEASVAGLNAYRGSERVKDFIRRNPSYANIVVPPFKGYQKPVDAATAEGKRLANKHAANVLEADKQRARQLQLQIYAIDQRILKANATKPANQKQLSIPQLVAPYKSRLDAAIQETNKAMPKGLSAQALEGAMEKGEALEPIQRSALHKLHIQRYLQTLYEAHLQREINIHNGIPSISSMTPQEIDALKREAHEMGRKAKVSIKEKKR